MDIWGRIRSAVRGAQSTIASEPSHLAPVAPYIEDALEILRKKPCWESVDELEYLLKKTQAFVAKWRPSADLGPGVFYIQPPWAKSTDEQAGEALGLLNKLRESGDMESVEPNKPVVSKTMTLFISHSSADASIAEGLVELIRSSLSIPPKEIRCTSVDGYRLPAGAASDEQLRSEVFGSNAFVALLSPASMRSTYVMFELGARWGSNQYLAPILVGGTKATDLKAPLSAIHAINGASESDLHQFIEDLGQRLKVNVEGPAVYNKALREFIDAAT